MTAFCREKALPEFSPFGAAFHWDPGLVWLHASAEAGIALAYLAFPVLLAIFLSRKRETPYMSLFVTFALFGALGGAVHLVAIIEIWKPIFWTGAVLEALTALVSIATVVMLAPVLPKLMKLSNPIVDSLTALPNRLLFVDRVGLASARIKRENHELLAVLLLDIDGFKRVNDSLGFEAGDQLLVRVAKRLNHAVRAIDTVARFGGDEFVLLLERVEGPLYAKGVARRIISELERPFPFGEVNVQISASVGIVISDGTDTPDDLIGAADAAMYRAKQSHGGTFELYDKGWNTAEVLASGSGD
jgi:diguanylate cyclase (GGDEF)-like protein